jgi:hypothetical protein
VLLPWITVADAGVALTEKSGAAGGFTISVTEAVWLSVPLVPVIVNEKLPAGVVLAVVTVRVDEPEATEAGLKLAVAPVGNPLTLKLTVPVNPPEGVTVTV